MPDPTPVTGARAALAALADAGVRVPGGFATTAEAFRVFLKNNDLDKRIQQRLDTLDADDVRELAAAGAEIRQWIIDTPFPAEFEKAVRDAFAELDADGKGSFAVRSSATAEDLPDASFAGQQETYLNVVGIDEAQFFDEALVEVVAATDGLVVSVGESVLPGYIGTPVRPRYDVVYVLDDRGWYYRYSHLHSIEEGVKPGTRLKLGQKIGLLGKEGASGGWSHLHFGIKSRQPSGEWGTEEAYAFAWQAALREQKPAAIAVARPHHFVRAGERLVLDGSKSWAAAGIEKYEWAFTDGTSAAGTRVERGYDQPGCYSEVLKITGRDGAVSYDFAIVQVIGDTDPKLIPPAIHATCAPSLGVKAGDEITFKVRVFRSTGGETWDFGDGTPPVQTRSDGNAVKLARDGYAATTHRFEKPGDHLVRVEHVNERGEKAVAHLWVPVAAAR